MQEALRKRKQNRKRIKKLSLQNQTDYNLKLKYNKFKKEDKKFKANILALLFLSFIVMGFITIKNYIKLNNTRNEYNSLQSQYTSYQLTRDRLNKNLEDTVDLKEIQRYAIEELGMVYENKNNIVYLDIDR
ncbi:septum formation initiator [Anaerococcus sp. AGMB00486]|uniref:Septum formation initiator n=2 Tax=Anaerococcus TaxID=165779 RepID=A0ABX2NBE7_9FIRM|nr:MULTISPECIES: septum formation initiator [Anaerococcus]MDY3005513.1 septum formation initiator [Anaerococcus porci]MSS78227.1 septum formation initiator [Anaerococcus porci]NVF11985.1 septum formation initiator [Anaerococcus faecalis]